MKLDTGSILTIAAAAVIAAPTSSFADASAQAYVQDERTPHPTPPAVTDPIQATTSAGAPGDKQYAYAFANEDTGILRIAGNSSRSYPYVTTANASASFSEIVSFSGGFGQTAYLDYSFDGGLGILAPLNAPAAAFGQFQAYVANIGGSNQRYETLSGYAGNCGTGTNCVVGTSTARLGTLAFTIFAGPNTIVGSLTGFSSWGNSFDFANTAKFYLRVPDGVTFSSANGFLSTASPIGAVSAVPEPETYALVLCGLSAIGLRRRWLERAKFHVGA